MESMFNLVGIIIIVFGVLQIILFFKIWAMTNKVTSIDNKLNNQRHKYSFYMLMEDKEKAFLTVKEELVLRLIELDKATYDGRRFIKLANDEIPNYIEKMKATGFDVPGYLTSAENFIAYYKQLKIN